MDLPPAVSWPGVVFCLSQSAMFSGLNLAFFSIGRLRLEAEVEKGNRAAAKILHLRKDANFLLCTILWGNVAVNVLLALLMESALPALIAFFVATLGITFFGEIMPQAYFSRNALRMGSLLAPVIRFYQIILWPVAKPSALILDGWVGAEGVNFMRERDIEIILQKHIHEQDSEISETEGQGALNFLDLDDRLISREGNPIEPDTIFAFPTHLDLPIFPSPGSPEFEAFLEKVRTCGQSRALITDEKGQPRIVLKTSRYLFELSRNDSASANGDGGRHRAAVGDEEGDGGRANGASPENPRPHARSAGQAEEADEEPGTVTGVECEDSAAFLAAGEASGHDPDIYAFCHRPIVVTDPEATLDHVLGQFVVEADHGEDHIVDRDVVIYWTEGHRRIITGADILGRLLEGIARRVDAPNR